MDNPAIFIVPYLFAFPIAIFSLFFMPRRGTLSPYMENARRNTAIVGLIPCGPLGLIVAAIGGGIYYMRIKSIMAKEEGLAANWRAGGANLASGNPFGGGGGSGQRPPAVNEGNAGDRPRDNPFA